MIGRSNDAKQGSLDETKAGVHAHVRAEEPLV